MLPIAFAFCSANAAATPRKVTFDDLKPGEAPSGWVIGFFGDKGAPKWSVAAEPSAPSKPNVLRQSGSVIYGFLVAPALNGKDGSVQSRFRIESGKEDPEAGLVLRFQDAKNYLYVRANSLEKNLVFYRMNAGKKELVKSVEAQVSSGQWHELRVEFTGESFKVSLDGRELMSLTDAVIKGSGLVGVWTTADTVVAFDDFEAALP